MGSISSKVLNAHSFYGVTSANIGECGICGDKILSGQNQAYTMCKHLFCISCLLKWCKRCHDQGHDVPTCPLCRDTLYDNDEENGREENEDIEIDTITTAVETMLVTALVMTVVIAFTSEEDRELHENMPRLVAQHAIRFCQRDPESYEFTGDVMFIEVYNNANIIQAHNQDSALNGIPVGHQCRSYCVIKTTTQEYHIGKIESMSYNLDGANRTSLYFGFRKMNHDLTLALIPQAIPFSSIETLHQYVPRIRAHV